ncbi:hypothetical protein O6H91_05G090300 [Diphasiastrum complanatum]|uniref:Uncharacterized protein n=1 Tax=Diphasiastrum complanatum TaxID=34168 RepID=A0ACC2DQP2_DIPCM|nr:hypothetical protein O6H91_05G090300 [Diphasiastrum complanatum]
MQETIKERPHEEETTVFTCLNEDSLFVKLVIDCMQVDCMQEESLMQEKVSPMPEAEASTVQERSPEISQEENSEFYLVGCCLDTSFDLLYMQLQYEDPNYVSQAFD